jgi:phytoene dehydrogenase-like protein
VTLADGRYFEARRAIVSGINHVTTLLKLVGEQYLDKGLVRKINAWKWHDWTIFGAHISLNEAPRYRAAQDNPQVNEAFHPVFGYDEPADLLRHYQILERGELPDDPSGEAWCLTLFDPSQAPPGKHVAGFWQFVPYELAGGGAPRWDEIKDEYLDKCIGRWREYAPNLTDENIVRKFAYTPLNTEREIVSMIHGDAHHGDYAQQLGMNRPCPELARYRTPIKNLYLCSSSSHPSGSITFAPGYNAVNIIATDLGLKRWWSKPEYLQNFALDDWK